MPEGVSIHTTPSGPPPVTACINVFNDVDWLSKCLQSLRGKVKATVVVDGAYEGFPHEKPYSTDGTIELAKEFADVVITKDTAWANEIVKRNHYIRYIQDDEWWMRIDADEELEGEFGEPLEGVCYQIMLHRTDNVLPYPIHALFRKDSSSRIYGTHHSVWYGRTLLPKLEDLPVYPGVTLIHYNNDRCQERVKAKGIYYRNALRESERAFRKRFHL